MRMEKIGYNMDVTGAVIVVSVFAVPAIVLGLVRGWRAFKNPDYGRRSALSRRYVDDQFKRPPNEGDLL
jgi:hypothetical protein